MSNDEVYNRAGNPTRLTTIIKRSRLRLLGHVARLPEDVPARKILVEASLPPPRTWHRPRGRPRRTWTAEMANIAPLSDLIIAAQDRARFRETVATIT